MKKQVSAILAAGMAASLLVGCGGGSTSTAPAESTSTAASTEAAAPAESTEAGQAADITHRQVGRLRVRRCTAG